MMYSTTARHTSRRWSANKPHNVCPGRFESKRPSNSSSQDALSVVDFIAIIESRIALQRKMHVAGEWNDCSTAKLFANNI